jgi:hypothetical protein
VTWSAAAFFRAASGSGAWCEGSSRGASSSGASSPEVSSPAAPLALLRRWRRLWVVVRRPPDSAMAKAELQNYVKRQTVALKCHVCDAVPLSIGSAHTHTHAQHEMIFRLWRGLPKGELTPPNLRFIHLYVPIYIYTYVNAYIYIFMSADPA